MPATIKINNYNVKIQKGLINRLGLEILRLSSESESELEMVLITDEKNSSLYLQNIITNFQECPRPEGMKLRFCELLLDSESAGNFHSLPKLLEDMSALSLSEKCCVAALGDKKICASAAFASQCYMSGVKLVLIPVTLEAMLVTCTGVRAELELSSGKNFAGVNYQPSLVLCDPECLNALPEDEYKSNLIDALSIAVLNSRDMLRLFEADDICANLDEIIELCIKFKAANTDSEGRKKFLSSCVVSAQAFERLHSDKIPHVIAAAQGIAIVARAGLKLNWFSGNTAMRILNAIKKLDLPLSYRGSLRAGEVAHEIMKINKDGLKFALPSDSGDYVLREFKESEFESVISAGMTL
ncbi:MAG: hypothetical protein IJP48_10160 [Synergistaceae bacterium]|nr:hypothetical protein [Synergistaceae bacterium]